MILSHYEVNLTPLTTPLCVYIIIFLLKKGNSTGPPDYKPKWEEHKTWVFGSQYFMEINSTLTNHTVQGRAATGDLFETKQGEIIYTKFELYVRE